MRRVAVLAYDRAPTFELAIPGEVFGAPAVSDLYRVVAVAGEPGTLRTEHGWSVPARKRAGRFTGEDIVVVAGWRDVDEAPPRELLRLVERAATGGSLIVSLCTGAFVLAAAGLLDGRRATTHWRYANRLAERHPRVHVDVDALFVDGPDVCTSAGTVAGVDLCLHLIRREHGAQLANDVARHLVVGAQREGGQAQYVAAPLPDARMAQSLGPSASGLLGRLDEPLSISALAREAHLSTRQYQRRFRAATGTSPYRWLLGQRVLLARELLERSDEPIERVAVRCGFRDATALRTHFRRIVGTTPSRYRAEFGGGDPRGRRTAHAHAGGLR